jgi:hypothetical protein
VRCAILTCETAATLADVARLMATHPLHCVAVMGARADAHENASHATS